jgi:hypothetical protein
MSSTTGATAATDLRARNQRRRPTIDDEQRLIAVRQVVRMHVWGTQSFFRLSRGATPPKRDEVPLGFRVDNIHWARDGSLFAVGQSEQSCKAVKIDPSTLAMRDVLVQADTAEFNAGTALVEVGDELWVGSFRGNRIVIVPIP